MSSVKITHVALANTSQHSHPTSILGLIKQFPHAHGRRVLLCNHLQIVNGMMQFGWAGLTVCAHVWVCVRVHMAALGKTKGHTEMCHRCGVHATRHQHNRLLRREGLTEMCHRCAVHATWLGTLVCWFQVFLDTFSKPEASELNLWHVPHTNVHYADAASLASKGYCYFLGL